ncbi:extracellular solute-binding protein [Paenibacillus hemerocallicola]|uniref:Extracellular solute-binding protein n=1 Tax=Paenibacillus hemerocallicola TaxID=1172614 RepID=A0A5C4T8V8_9BACL|nr:extracellular solute-binding protein [Paenibacillus hemerocallicola]TNJ65508.1 extracellular solute-binding protein [Paenibacillus hemerocallicola]
MTRVTHRFQPFRFAWAVLASSIALSACGSSGTTEPAIPPASDGQGRQAANLDDEPVELVFHSNTGDPPEAFDNLFGNALRKKFPNYTITYIQSKKGQTLEELLVQNQPVDVLFSSISNIFGLIMENKLEYDMAELVKTQQIDISQFEPTLIDGIRLSGNGKLYALPVTNMVQVMFYNKMIFNRFGVPYPIDGMTWEETTAMARKLTRKDNDKQILGFSASPPHMFRGNQLSQPYLDPATDKPTFGHEAWSKLIQTYFLAPGAEEAYKSKSFQLKRLPNIRDFTNSQDLAMFVYNSQTPFTTLEMKNVDWDLVSLPVFKEQPKLGMAAAPFTLAITSISKRKEAAMNAIRFLVSRQNQDEFSKRGMMPVIKDEAVRNAYGQESEYKDKNWKAVYYNDYAALPAYSKYNLKVQNVLNNVPFQLITGSKDMNTALREAEEEVKKLLDEAKR